MLGCNKSEKLTFAELLRSENRRVSAQSFTLWQQAPTEVNRRNHSIIACSRHLHMRTFHSHPVRDVSHIQRRADRDVAIKSPPFYNEPHRSHVLCVKVAPRVAFTLWSQHHFVTIREPEQKMRKASYCGSKQATTESTAAIMGLRRKFFTGGGGQQRHFA